MLINKIPNIKITLRGNSQFAFWRLINIIVSGILLIGMLLAILFVYKNINTALINAALISNIKSNLTFDTLDLKGFDKAKKMIESKKQTRPFQTNVRNIFIYSEKTTNVSSNQTTK